MRLHRYLLSLGLLLAGIVPGWAHVMPEKQGNINIVGDHAYVSMALPADRFAMADDNRDGQIDSAELQRHAADIQRAFAAQFALKVGDAAAKPTAETFVMLPHADAPGAGYRYVIVAQQYHLPASQGALSLSAHWLEGAREGELLSVHASRGNDTDLAILSPNQTEARLFLSPWQTLLRYVPVGMEHILLGLDHLLFLLTVVVAAAGWRYWLAVVSSFTLAHSVTLTLSAFNIVAWPASVVEPLIAFSIVLMGADNLLRRQVSTAQRAAFVFLCGLLHGMGFAGAVGEAGLSSSHKLASIAGFNLGIEMGQATFLIGLFVLLRIAGALIKLRSPLPATRLASLAAVVLGTGMLGARLMG